MSLPPAALPDRRSVDVTFAALADPVRRRAVELLSERPRRSGELAGELGVSPAVMSRHLRVLRTADLVDEEHPPFDARVRMYSLRTASMHGIRGWLADTEAGWAQQLGAFKDHVENG